MNIETLYYNSHFIPVNDFEQCVANKANSPIAINIQSLRKLTRFLNTNEIAQGIAFEEAHQRLVLDNPTLQGLCAFTLRGPYDRRFLVIIYDNTEDEYSTEWLSRLDAMKASFKNIQSETRNQITAHPMGLWSPFDTIAYIIPEATCHAYLCAEGKEFLTQLEELKDVKVNDILKQYSKSIRLAMDITTSITHD